VAGDERVHHEIENDDQEHMPEVSRSEGNSGRRAHEILNRIEMDRQLEEQHLISVIRNLRSLNGGKN
jgi:hypothetical protein